MEENLFKVGLDQLSAEDRHALFHFRNTEHFRLFHKVISAYQNMTMYQIMKPGSDVNETVRLKGVLTGLEVAKNILSMSVDPEQPKKNVHILPKK